MESIVVSILDDNGIQLLYSSVKFKEGREVTGYLIYPDFTSSNLYIFNDLGDGIYGVRIEYERQTSSLTEKCGIVIKENGVPKHFSTLRIIN